VGVRFHWPPEQLTGESLFFRPPERNSVSEEEAAACTTISAGYSPPNAHAVLNKDWPHPSVPPGGPDT